VWSVRLRPLAVEHERPSNGIGRFAGRVSSPAGPLLVIECRVPVRKRSPRLPTMKKLLILIALIALGTVAAKKIKAV
jgi:hypothetical protein